MRERNAVPALTGSDLESKIGIDPADELLSKRWALVVKVAELRARFGAFGTWDNLRKIELARIKGLVRAEAHRDKRKLSNDQVDE